MYEFVQVGGVQKAIAFRRTRESLNLEKRT